MYEQVVQTLFKFDQPFLRLAREGLAPDDQQVMRDFWMRPEFAPLAPTEWPALKDVEGLIRSFRKLPAGPAPANILDFWFKAAAESEKLAATQPMAACLIALRIFALWTLTGGPRLFEQPWAGYHAGWNVFPLSLARNLAAAQAFWSAKMLARYAAEFVEASKMAKVDPTTRGASAEYRTLLKHMETQYSQCIQELAWELREACGGAEPNFRPELAALFWSNGNVIQANLLSSTGSKDYLPSVKRIRDLVSESMRRIPDDPFQQYIWLAMKDRPPFNLRDHKVLFGQINARFNSTRTQLFDEIGPVVVSQVYAALAINYFAGNLEKEKVDRLHEAFELYDTILVDESPAEHIRIVALLNLAIPPDDLTPKRWSELARYAGNVTRQASRSAFFNSFDRVLDIPFYYLPLAEAAEKSQWLESFENFRCGKLWYWMQISPPLSTDEPAPQSLRQQETELLTELRGARFIRLLPRLPKHYQRYTFSYADTAPDGTPMGEALTKDKQGQQGGFNPFDQNMALTELRESSKRLVDLHASMEPSCPIYASKRNHPVVAVETFLRSVRVTK